MASNSSNFTAGNTAESDMLAEFEERFNSLFADHMKPIDDAFYDLMIGLSNPTTTGVTEGFQALSELEYRQHLAPMLHQIAIADVERWENVIADIQATAHFSNTID